MLSYIFTLSVLRLLEGQHREHLEITTKENYPSYTKTVSSIYHTHNM